MRIFFLFFICTSLATGHTQGNGVARFEAVHATYQAPELTHRRFKHSDVEALLAKLPAAFVRQQEGLSMEGRPIYSVHIGTGKTKVLLWSQMHGDEPTATAALMDVFNFLAADDMAFAAYRKTVLSRLTLIFLPMLNPDGAEAYERRNALGIDLNRDALSLATPEAQILKRVRDEHQAAWGFNLHDQNRYYGAGDGSGKLATLSFLAPAYNREKSTNAVRLRAIQVIAQLNAGLQPLIPGQVARYDDAFEPRAFGDNMQKWGTSTILIESGGYLNDPEKQYIRRLNFAVMLAAFHSIATQSYSTFTTQDYNKIPYNDFNAFNDLLLRGVTFLHESGSRYLVDIAFNTIEQEYMAARDFYPLGTIMDVGELTYQFGYKELPARGYTAEIGALYPVLFPDLATLQALDADALFRQGYAVAMVEKTGPPWERTKARMWVVGAEGLYDDGISPGQNPPLIIRAADGRVVYAVVNGRLLEVAQE